MQASFFSSQQKLGILGGGQLGKMLLHVARQWDIHTKVLDPDTSAPAQFLSNEFQVGKLNDFQTVYDFGKDCDVLTIEIEHVNIEALKKLNEEGVIIHPNPQALEIIKDKGLQKSFFKEHNLPSAPFQCFENAEEIKTAVSQNKLCLPFVQKSRKDGYDGKGVFLVKSEKDLPELMNVPSLVEDLVSLDAEMALIAARNKAGQVEVYAPVEMTFVEGANMLDVLKYPMTLPGTLEKQARDIAHTLIEKLNICGMLAVEFFIDKQQRLYINEIAPRPHNSGHQTIESCITSQYEQHLRGILNVPLGSTKTLIPSVMLNLLGEPGFSGDVNYERINDCMGKEGVHIHIYGKKQTRPYRKMGHVTITHESIEEAVNIATWVKQTLKVKSH